MPIDLHRNMMNVSIDDRVATIKFERPEVLNAMNEEMVKEFVSALKEISMVEDLDILLLKGNERAFSAGRDIKNFLATETKEEEFEGFLDWVNELSITLYSMPMVTISAINGSAAGLGLSLALATDYVVAHEESKIVLNFINIGLIPDGGAHFFLENRLGEDLAKQLIWEGRILTAKEAKEIGLIHEVSSNVNEAVEEKINQWLKRPLKAMIKSKKILGEKNRLELLKILELEKQGQLQMRKTEDHKEGIHAFLEKRKPNFVGK